MFMTANKTMFSNSIISLQQHTECGSYEMMNLVD